MSCCPTCGRKMVASKPRKSTSVLPERAELDAALAGGSLTRDAYLKACARIARRDDVRFFLRVAAPLPQAMRDECTALLAELETRPATTAEMTRFRRIQFEYRTSREVARRIVQSVAA